MIETLYVHLPLKRSMYAVNPLQRLRLLRRKTETLSPNFGDREFFDDLLSIFNQLRDLHTNFVLPEPFSSSTVFLPFRVERCLEDNGLEAFVVSYVMEGQEVDASFSRGSVITHWNGTPIQRVVAANADREAGSNPAARAARGLSALTIRWLGQSLLPDEDWVDLQYLPRPGAPPENARFYWKVFQRQAGVGASEIAKASENKIWAIGMDARAESERLVRRHLFGKAIGQLQRVKHFADVTVTPAEWAAEVFPVAGDVHTPSGTFAYIRLATFNVDEEQPYLDEFIRLLAGLSQDGLILDVRGNGGGLISFGERMLQLLTPQPIDPARFSFLNTLRTQNLTRKHPFIGQWGESIAQWVETGAEYSQGFPLLPIKEYNDIGQKYQGPIVLVTDALCYSTTDIFAAGFQDHEIGTILGLDTSTGAGGANVWDYRLISSLLKDENFPLDLPGSASFRFAVRRVTRIGRNTGVLLEDLGVKPDKMHRLTRRDVLERNGDLLECAGKILAKGKRQHLTARLQTVGQVEVGYRNIDRIDAYLDGHPLQASLIVKKSSAMGKVQISLPPEGSGTVSRLLKLEGFRRNSKKEGVLVAATRLSI